MKLQKYKSQDCSVLAELFYDTVHSLCIRDYTTSELNAWATGSIDLSSWDKSFLENHTIVARVSDNIVGFGDMDCTGYLNRLYVHKGYQGEGIATAIVSKLSTELYNNDIKLLTVHSSITAKTFFEKLGYITTRKNIVIRSGIEITNFIMTRQL